MNTKKSQELIRLAINSMPSDFALREARTHLARALQEIHKVEAKRENKSAAMTPAEKWQLDLKTGALQNPAMNFPQQRSILQEIDRLISEEEKKIKAIHTPKTNILLED